MTDRLDVAIPFEFSSESIAEPTRFGKFQALLIVIAVVVVFSFLIYLSGKLGILNHLFAGYLFAIYWGGIKGSAAKEFLPAIFGSIAGLAVAYLGSQLPQLVGPVGHWIALSLILIALYALLLQFLPLIINNAMMIFLTLGTPPLFRQSSDYIDSGVAILMVAFALGGMDLLSKNGRKIVGRVGPT
jgi:hypothetical protein